MGGMGGMEREDSWPVLRWEEGVSGMQEGAGGVDPGVAAPVVDRRRISFVSVSSD
jgi:hypothetical protein